MKIINILTTDAFMLPPKVVCRIAETTFQLNILLKLILLTIYVTRKITLLYFAVNQAGFKILNAEN
jgi:hypothetical protein